MARPNVTYSDYTELYGSEVSSEQFASCLHSATSVVAELCWPNTPTTDAQTDAWVCAVCAAIQADALNGYGHGVADAGAGSFTIGKFSMSAGSTASGSASATLDAMRNAARRELVGSGLMYRVIA